MADIDEAMNHFDIRGMYSKEVGVAIADAYDTNVQKEMVLGARASATMTSSNGGTSLTNASYATSGSTLAGGMFDAAQNLDEKDVPSDGRYAYFRPAQYYLLAETTDVINKDWGGAGNYAKGTVFEVAGIGIVKSNNVPITDLSGDATHGVNAENNVGQVAHRSGVGTVKLRGFSVEQEYDIRRQGTLVVAKNAVGHGFLRPEACVEFKTS